MLITAGATYLQYRLAHIQLPVELGASKIAIPPIRSGEELVIVRPVFGSTLLFGHSGDTKEFVDVILDRATVDPETQGLYNLDPRAQSISDYLSYSTQPAGASKVPCTTDFEARATDEKRLPEEMRFFQSDAPGNERYRSINAQFDQEVLLVVNSSPTESGPVNENSDLEEDGPGCIKRLEGGQLKERQKQKVLVGALTMKSNIVANSRVTLRFFPMEERNPIWNGHSGFLEPFTVASPIFEAAQISIGSSSNGSVRFEITGSEKNQPLRVNALRVGSDKLDADISGKGYVTVDGEIVTLRFFERIQQYPLYAGLFAMMNAGLLAWLTRVVRSLFHPSGEPK